MANLIEVKHLKKYFETPKGLLHAVDDVSFHIKAGQTMGVVGESGCGKSTLGRTLIHLLDSTGGTIFFEGKDVTHVNAKQLYDLRADMQIIFQDPYSSVNPRMTVEQTISEPLLISGRFSKKELEEETERLMDMVGVDRRLRLAYPHELDGGRRQRVGIGRALALNPKFVVCDEPVSALDVSIQAQILNLLKSLQKELGLTYIFITHDLSVVKYFADDIGVMYLGQMVEKASSADIFAEPLHPYTKALLSAVPVPVVGQERRKRQLIRGEITSPVNLPDECRFCSRCDESQEAVCRAGNPPLREVKAGHFVACARL